MSRFANSARGDGHRATAVQVCALCLGLGADLGCERRAPGPHECHDFARRALGIPEQMQHLPPRFKAVVDDLTLQCLTTPFDRELLGCVDAGRGGRQCLAEYKRRMQLSE